jgi:protein associated with RNAse G/E
LNRPVTVQFLKNPDIIHWGFEAQWLGEDEWGDWIAVPVGSRRWKGPVSMEPTPEPAVFCAPREHWWHLHYNGSFARNYSHFVDITTPPAWVSENRYEMIDLDLDVAVHVDGTIEVQDEDEFEVHQVKYSYTVDMIDNAVRETESIVEQLHNRREPFFDVAEHWLGRVGG